MTITTIEFGLIIPLGRAHLHERVPALLDQAGDDLPGAFRQPGPPLVEHWNHGTKVLRHVT